MWVQPDAPDTLTPTLSQREREEWDYFATSMSAAAPMPPPMHIVTTP